MSPCYGSPVGPPLGSVQSGSKAGPAGNGGGGESTTSILTTPRGSRGRVKSVEFRRVVGGIREDDEMRWREVVEGEDGSEFETGRDRNYHSRPWTVRCIDGKNG